MNRKDYVDYADLCFSLFGDRVKLWNTFNEPTIFCMNGYATGIMAPGRCSPYASASCAAGGDSGREPYVAGHHLLVAHAEAVRLYRARYRRDGGEVGITQVSHWFDARRRLRCRPAARGAPSTSCSGGSCTPWRTASTRRR